MSIELKPCPFCGSEAEIMGDQYPYVECQECAAGFTANHSYEFDRADAASKWNARAQGDAEPVGYALVPKALTLDFKAMDILKMMTGDGETEDEFTECTLWVGRTTDDDGVDGAYGLNVACNELLEEGSAPIIEFPQPPKAQAVPEWVFDGYAVYEHLSVKAQYRTSTENVSDTLDAIKAMLTRQPPKKEGE